MAFWIPKTLGFHSLIWGLKWEKLKLQKIVGNLLDKLRKLHMNGTVYSLPQNLENSRQVLFLWTDISK